MFTVPPPTCLRPFDLARLTLARKKKKKHLPAVSIFFPQHFARNFFPQPFTRFSRHFFAQQRSSSRQSSGPQALVGTYSFSPLYWYLRLSVARANCVTSRSPRDVKRTMASSTPTDFTRPFSYNANDCAKQKESEI